MLDFNGPLDQLKEAISAAPSGAHEMPEYQYAQGLIVGRGVTPYSYSRSTIDDMRAAAEIENDHYKQGWCSGLEIAGAWEPPAAA